MAETIANALPPCLVGYAAAQTIERFVEDPVERVLFARKGYLSSAPLVE
jgi:hypothetical protein